MARDDRPAEQPAVKTTIVGGRPPGPGKGLGPIPRGIEVLIKKAAVDPAFKRLLLETRDEAAREIDLALDPAEAMMLRAAPRGQLEAIIARTRVHPTVRSAFLGRAAAVMLVALGAGAVGCEDTSPVDGIRPDVPPVERVEPPPAEETAESPPPDPEPVPHVVTGIQPAPPETEPPPPAARQHIISLGIQPEQPEVAPKAQPPVERPQRVEPTDGIRPTRPPQAAPQAESPAPEPKPSPPAPTGIRPDRPPEAKPPRVDARKPSRATAPGPVTTTTTSDALTRGVRPDRPKPESSSAGTTTDEPPEAPPTPTLTLPDGWSEQQAMRAFVRGLKNLALRLMPKHALAFKDGKNGRITLTWKTQEYKLTVPGDKIGATKVVDATGPAPDGLMLTVWMQKQPDQAVRPQTLDRDGRWKTDLKRVQLLPLKTYLNYNLDYGPKTKKTLTNIFSTPQIWYQMHTAPQPGEAVSRGVRPDRPPQTKGIRPDRPKSEDR
jgi:hypothetical protein